jgi:hypothetical protein
MAVELDFDFEVEREFYWSEHLPIVLMEKIEERKEELYGGLTKNPLDPSMMTNEETFLIEGRRFEVVCGLPRSEWLASSGRTQKLRVLLIWELGSLVEP